MVLLSSDNIEEESALIAAKLMASSARTAPKARGIDRITTAIISGKEKDMVAEAMEKKAKQKPNLANIFLRDAENLRKSQFALLIGVKGTMPKKPESPFNCGACGHKTCQEFISTKKVQGEDFTGPICIFEAIDLGIAIGSAVKMASELNVDNRIMYTVGAAAKQLGIIEGDVVMGIPISITGKSIYFDRK